MPAENPQAIAQRLRGELPPGLPVWSSPSLRCRQLATLLHPEPGFDERLQEMDFGAWEGRPWDAIPRAELDAWAADVDDYAPPGGESPHAMQQRVLGFIAGLTAPEVAIVTHAGVARVLQAWWHGLPLAASLDFQLAYGERLSLICDRSGRPLAA